MNFDFLKQFPKLAPLYRACQAAEVLVPIAPAQSCGSARSALEFVVTLIYRSVNGSVCPAPTLFEMMCDPGFVGRVNDETLISAMHTVRKNGNLGAHGEEVGVRAACETLEQLQFIVGEFCMNLCIIDDYPEFTSPLASARPVKPQQALSELAPGPASTPVTAAPLVSAKQESLPCSPSEGAVAEFAETLRRTKFSTLKHRDENENKRLYVKASLREAHWKIAKAGNQLMPEAACLNMMLDDGSTIDCVLCGRDSRPLAVIDYTNAMKSPVVGRMVAVQAADQMQKKFGYRPTAYYVTGYRIVCIDPLGYPPRAVFGFHTLDELDLLKKRAGSRLSIQNPSIDDNITNRDYQKEAIAAVCRAFENNNRRRGLIVMATGTGKTRVAISLVDVLTKANWAKNVLFLADRISLVRQAHKSFNKLLPNLTTSIFAGSSTNRDKSARLVFSTYQTMIGMIDGEKREFGIGRFDLIVVDEAHRSLFSKYRRLFDYFDALMVGLTATPRCEEAKSTYEVFDIKSGVPDYTYELEDAIADGYLVGFSVLDRTTESQRRGFCYDELSDEEKRAIEEQLNWQNGVPVSSAGTEAGYVMDKRIINKDTIRVMLRDLMENGVKIEAGDKLGKTIIFTKYHREAEIVVECFNAMYDRGPDFCKLIDSSVEGAQSLIDGLVERDKMPQIAVSVDMLDTGIDVPDAVNLVFFRSVRSKIKFLQMVGRGTRLSPNLFGPGMDKKGFLAFDYYDNFRYFNTHQTWTAETGAPRISDNGSAPRTQSGYVNLLKLTILQQLQGKPSPSAFEKRYEQELHEFFRASIAALDNDAIDVDKNLAYVNKYRTDGALDHLTKGDVDVLTERVLPLLPAQSDSARVKSFDALILKIESEYEAREQEGRDPAKIRYGFKSVANEFSMRMEGLQKQMNIPQVRKQEKLINSMKDGSYLLDNFTLERAEDVRLKLRELMAYLPDDEKYYVIDLPDKLIDGSELGGLGGSSSYEDRVSEYLADGNNVILEKLRTLEPLTAEEQEELRRAFTEKMGSPADYVSWSGDSEFSLPFIRKQVGIAEEAIQAKVGSIVNDPSLTPQQKAYYEQMVLYARANGDIDAMTLQKRSPFKDMNLVKLFGPEGMKRLKSVLDALHGPIKQVG